MGNTVSRRSLIKGAALAGTVVLAGGLTVGEGRQAHAEEQASDGQQYGFWIDTENCVACFDCIEACAKANKTPWDKDRLSYQTIDGIQGDHRTFLVACQHCTDPACVTVCPAHAITKGEGGIVTVDKERCIGCKYCYHACPFSVPKYTSRGMDKCDYCREAGVALGEPTNCVAACTHDALHCGTIDDLKAQSDGKGRAIECSTGPNCLFS